MVRVRSTATNAAVTAAAVSAVGAGGAGRGGGQARVQGLGRGAAAVADRGQPGRQALRREPVGMVLGGEAVRNRRLIAESMSAEQPDRAGEADLQVRAQLVGHRDPVGDQVLAGPHGLAQRGGGRGVDQQRAQPAPVGAHDVGQHVGVEPVVLVAGRAVAAAQVLDLAGWDDADGQPGREQRVDDRAVGAFDPDLGHPGGQQARTRLRSPAASWVIENRGSARRRGRRPRRRGRPWPSRPRRSGRGGSGGIGDTHRCLLAVGAVGRHPVVPGHGSRSLTDRRSMAHSPVASRRVLGHRTSQNSWWTSRVERARRWPGGDLRCARILDQDQART